MGSNDRVDACLLGLRQVQAFSHPLGEAIEQITPIRFRFILRGHVIHGRRTATQTGEKYDNDQRNRHPSAHTIRSPGGKQAARRRACSSTREFVTLRDSIHGSSTLSKASGPVFKKAASASEAMLSLVAGLTHHVATITESATHTNRHQHHAAHSGKFVRLCPIRSITRSATSIWGPVSALSSRAELPQNLNFVHGECPRQTRPLGAVDSQFGEKGPQLAASETLALRSLS